MPNAKKPIKQCCLTKRSRLVILHGYIANQTDAVSAPDMRSHKHILNCMELAADEGVAQATGAGFVSEMRLEQVRSTFCAVINHAISLGLGADGFLRCWNEGDWAGCAEFGFHVDAEGNPRV